jgi:integrase/recombinase XerD
MDELTRMSDGEAGALVERFERWLREERGLAVTTVPGYVRVARRFLGECEGRDLVSLTLGDVNGFVVRECRRRSSGSAARSFVPGLRSLLRWLFLDGLVDRELAAAVPWPASWRSGLPRGVSAADLAVLLAVDEGVVGSRDRAIVLMLARLGLRAGEVAALSLDDLDWVRGEIEVRGKGDRVERLPLPVDVGEALAGYLEQGRTRVVCRSVFVAAQTGKALSPGAVRAVASRACVRVGVTPVGAHRLRHSAATAMLRAGGSLDEVGQVLRQRSSETTAMYAKVDVARLAALALPWPGGVA